jgi:hypothetical protein
MNCSRSDDPLEQRRKSPLLTLYTGKGLRQLEREKRIREKEARRRDSDGLPEPPEAA